MHSRALFAQTPQLLVGSHKNIFYFLSPEHQQIIIIYGRGNGMDTKHCAISVYCKPLPTLHPSQSKVRPRSKSSVGERVTGGRREIMPLTVPLPTYFGPRMKAEPLPQREAPAWTLAGTKVICMDEEPYVPFSSFIVGCPKFSAKKN